MKGSDLFIAQHAEICSVSQETAEAIFPLIILDLLQTNSNDPAVCDELSHRVALILSGSAVFPRATQLAVNTLTFLLLQNIRRFVDLSTSSKAKADRRNGREHSSKGSDKNWNLPYSFSLNIDLKFCAEAAVRCGCVCSALLFSELADEERRAEEHAVKRAEEHSSSSEDNSSRVIENSSSSRTVAEHSSVSCETLMAIYQGVHDPDAVLGVDQSRSQSLQAAVYMHTGRLMATVH